MNPRRVLAFIDPNVRVNGNETCAGFEDVDGQVAFGDSVTAVIEETGGDSGVRELSAPAQVAQIDDEKRLVYLAVRWSEFL